MSPGTLVVSLGGWGIWPTPGAARVGDVFGKRIRLTRADEVGIVLASPGQGDWGATLVAWPDGLVGWIAGAGLGAAW